MSKEIKIDGGFSIHIGNINITHPSAAFTREDILRDVAEMLGGEEEDNDEENGEEPIIPEGYRKFEGIGKMFEDIQDTLAAKGIPIPHGLKEILEKIMSKGNSTSSMDLMREASQILHKAYHIVNNLDDLKITMGILLCSGYDEKWAKEAVKIPIDPTNPKSFKTFEGKISAGFALNLSNNAGEMYSRQAFDSDVDLATDFSNKL